jgi:ATP-dependent Clp protease adaptor protein ClpS
VASEANPVGLQLESNWFRPKYSFRRAVVAEKELYSVWLLNDNHTPMAFVVYALEEVFEMDTDAASELMLRVHNEGKAACESYPFDEASKNAAAVITLARKNQHPLQCVVEKSTARPA